MVAVATRLMVSEVRDRVLDRLGVGSAGQASPELQAQVAATIGSVQRTLGLSEEWLLPPRTRLTVSVPAGRSWLPCPTQPEGIIRVTWQQGTDDPYALFPDLVSEDRTGDFARPTRFGVTGTTGVVSVTVTNGGTGYVNGSAATFTDPGGVGYPATGLAVVSGGVIQSITITDNGADYAGAPTVTVPTGSSAVLTAVLGTCWSLLLDRAPLIPGIAVIEYQDKPALTPGLSDRLIIDEELVTLGVLAQLAAPSAQAQAQANAGAYLSRLRGSAPSGGSVSLSPLRRSRPW